MRCAPAHLIVDGSSAPTVQLHPTAVEVGITHCQQAGHVALSSTALVQLECYVWHEPTCVCACVCKHT